MQQYNGRPTTNQPTNPPTNQPTNQPNQLLGGETRSVSQSSARAVSALSTTHTHTNKPPALPQAAGALPPAGHSPTPLLRLYLREEHVSRPGD